MILTEEHFIKLKKNNELFRRIDGFCYSAKNLRNYANYLITQCSRISRCMKEGKELEVWESDLVGQINSAITRYNEGRKKPTLHPVSAQNGFISDAYFLSWYLKSFDEYKALPYATCSQICLQTICREWKSFYNAMKAWGKGKEGFLGMPKKPGYLDKRAGRAQLVITSQNFSIGEDRTLRLPSFLEGVRIKARHDNVRQLRVITERKGIRIQLMYKADEAPSTSASAVMGIDPGVDNLLAISMDTKAQPVLIDGRALKSVNRYFNKEKARLQSIAQLAQGIDKPTDRIRRLTERRNRKVKDFLHKTSRKVIDLATANGIGTIVIGKNTNWKQEVSMGKKTNQNFTCIPHAVLIDMIVYKAKLAGIRVEVVDEGYTSGTSYLDGEMPEKRYYDKRRRIHRGLFRSNQGLVINADVNAAYQIMKRSEGVCPANWGVEKVTRIKVA